MAKMRYLVKAIGIVLLIFVVGTLIFSIVEFGFFKSLAQESILYYGLPAAFIIAFFLDLFPQYLSAHYILIIVAINKMNLFSFSVVVIVATFLASVVGFWLGRKTEEDVFSDIFGENIYTKMRNGINKLGAWYVAVSAISPLPYIPILFGAMDMKWKSFMLWGVVPRVLGFIATAIFAHYALPVILKIFGA